MAAWLDLVSDSTGWTLVDTGRMEQLVHGMSHPHTQFPSVVYFAGNGSRIKALRALFPHNNITRRGPAGLVRLHLSTRTASTLNPILLAESSLSNVSGLGESGLRRWSSDNVQRYRILQDGTRRVTEIQQQVISQVLLPWTNVFCLFVDTQSDIRDACQLLKRPRQTVTIGSQSIPDLMHIVIVLTGAQNVGNEDLCKASHELHATESLSKDVTVLDLRDRYELSPTAAFEPLRRLILNEIQDIRVEQSRQGLSFSAIHLTTLWTRTLRLELGTSESSILDCLQVARENHRLNNITTECLVEFIKQATSYILAKNGVHAFIASALLMNAYPPGMHGALNEIDLILNGTSTEDSFRKFPAFARKVFQLASAPSQKFSVTSCAKWIKCLVGFFADGQYDGDNLENTLKEAINPARRIFDVSTTLSAGSRLAIITSRISDGKACVLANYRGIGQRAVDSAYEFLKPEDESQNPFLWEVARCSVAAPWFFQTKSLPGFGPLQDGGVRANNPLAIALKESAIIWPSQGTHDLLVSVGTGLPSSEAKAQDAPMGSIIQDGAVPRIIRAAMSSPSMDGEQGFYEALNYVPDRMRAHIFRLNHSLPWPLPRLDDVSRLEDLSELSYGIPDELVRAILATGFLFFELDQTPVRDQGSFYCEGSILCSSPHASYLIKRVLAEFPGPRFQIAGGYHLGPVSNDDGCSECGYYRKKVAFTVNSLEEVISIDIANSTFHHKIGGFPKSMHEFLNDQQVYANFGRADHRIACWPSNRVCYCSRGTKRRVQFLEPSPDRKKCRL
ncbi:hypothetical protein N7485_004809 [Penicillium canescens]|nr:hypothetical protein N7485_004809 [Penicillium canescens]